MTDGQQKAAIGRIYDTIAEYLGAENIKPNIPK